MTTSSASVSAETLKQLNAKFDELRALLNSLTPAVAETELVVLYYDDDKTKKSREYYQLKNNGRLHGKSIYYFRNGTIEGVCDYINGQPDGICINYKEDGSVMQVRKFENGVVKSTLDA